MVAALEKRYYCTRSKYYIYYMISRNHIVITEFFQYSENVGILSILNPYNPTRDQYLDKEGGSHLPVVWRRTNSKQF